MITSTPTRNEIATNETQYLFEKKKPLHITSYEHNRIRRIDHETHKTHENACKNIIYVNDLAFEHVVASTLDRGLI